MASLPSIVVGLFGLLVFVTMTGWGYTVMGGALALTILNLPGLTRVCENAISEVPSNVKEASLGLVQQSGKRSLVLLFRRHYHKLLQVLF